MEERNLVEVEVAGKKCDIWQQGSGGPVILWGMYPHEGNELTHMQECLKEMCPDQNFLLAAFQAADWNRDFSPWEGPAAFGKDDFAGEGPETLHWLTEEYVPYLRERYGADRPLFLIGYSLAGLFALWAAYQSDLFSGIACCSGSLWFEGWDEFVTENEVRCECAVYLSLGGKEEKTDNPVMAMVGDRTREQERLLRKEPRVRSVTLEWNRGGHFADSCRRLAKGVQWLL